MTLPPDANRASLHVLGFLVKATVAGAKEPQSISQRFTSRSAAEDYRSLARTSGFHDAYVHEVVGVEKSGLDMPRKVRKKQPPPTA